MTKSKSGGEMLCFWKSRQQAGPPRHGARRARSAYAAARTTARRKQFGCGHGDLGKPSVLCTLHTGVGTNKTKQHTQRATPQGGEMGVMGVYVPESEQNTSTVGARRSSHFCAHLSTRAAL